MTWIDDARGALVATTAQALGFELGWPTAGRDTLPCPACGAPTRHTKSKDKRGAVGTTLDGCGWHCFQCEVSGDAIDFVAFALAAARFRDLPPQDRDRVRQWFTGDAPHEAPRPRAVPRPVVPAAPVVANYPPHEEVAALWIRAVRVDSDPEVAAYLAGRGLDPAAVADADLARAVLAASPVPEWARIRGRPWTETGHRLVLPLVDREGAVKSLIARRVTEGTTPKSIAPAGHQRAGLLLADGLAGALLALGEAPPWWDADVPLWLGITEGEIDFLLCATSGECTTDAGHGTAMLGCVSGSWTHELRDRLMGCGIQVCLISTDLDEAGERYAAAIEVTLPETVKIRRWHP